MIKCFSFLIKLMTVLDIFVIILFPECNAISMGQGQEVHARRLLQQGFASGGWLLLQNCHLSLAYIEEVMDQIIETENIHEEFRLWVTTEVHKKFSINFLQVSHEVSKPDRAKSVEQTLIIVSI